MELILPPLWHLFPFSRIHIFVVGTQTTNPKASAWKYDHYFFVLEHSLCHKCWNDSAENNSPSSVSNFLWQRSSQFTGTLKCDWAAFFILRLFSRHHNIDIPVSVPTYFSKIVSNCKLQSLSKLLSKIELAALLYLEDPSENNTE